MDRFGRAKVAIIIFGVLILSAFWGYRILDDSAKNSLATDWIDYTQLKFEIDNQNIKTIIIDRETAKLEGEFYYNNSRNKKKFMSQVSLEMIENLIADLQVNEKKPLKIEFVSAPVTRNILINLLVSLLSLLLVGGAIILVIKIISRGAGSSGNSLGYFQSQAKIFKPEENSKITFGDVAGVDEAKEELGEIVDFLRNPGSFSSLGGRIPKGVLLVGPPGTGKTLLAKAVAGEANVPFFSISGSDFVEMYAGVGASRVRNLFRQALTKAPCIVFIDELDAVGRKRGSLSLSHEERESTLNQLLVEMDGFGENAGVIVIAATNRPDVLDSALMRPGRFDRQVVVDTPDINGRLAILKIHSRKVILEKDLDLKIIARGTPGFTGADLANLINEAALRAARSKRDSVNIDDLEWAKDKVMMGSERKSKVISSHEKRLIAYHEAGHAIVAASLPEDETDPLHKVTIIARGMSGGSTWQLPSEDRGIQSKKFLINKLAILMGGRAAEEIGLGECSTGAQHDIKVATDIISSMVCEWGMSRLGLIRFTPAEANSFLGNYGESPRNCSEDTAREIDIEMKNLSENAWTTAKRIITERQRQLEKVAKELIEHETLTGEEIKKILNQKES